MPPRYGTGVDSSKVALIIVPIAVPQWAPPGLAQLQEERIVLSMHLVQCARQFWLRQEGDLDTCIALPITPLALAARLALLQALHKLSLDTAVLATLSWFNAWTIAFESWCSVVNVARKSPST